MYSNCTSTAGPSTMAAHYSSEKQAQVLDTLPVTSEEFYDCTEDFDDCTEGFYDCIEDFYDCIGNDYNNPEEEFYDCLEDFDGCSETSLSFYGYFDATPDENYDDFNDADFDECATELSDADLDNMNLSKDHLAQAAIFSPKQRAELLKALPGISKESSDCSDSSEINSYGESNDNRINPVLLPEQQILLFEALEGTLAEDCDNCPRSLAASYKPSTPPTLTSKRRAEMFESLMDGFEEDYDDCSSVTSDSAYSDCSTLTYDSNYSDNSSVSSESTADVQEYMTLAMDPESGGAMSDQAYREELIEALPGAQAKGFDDGWSIINDSMLLDNEQSESPLTRSTALCNRSQPKYPQKYEQRKARCPGFMGRIGSTAAASMAAWGRHKQRGCDPLHFRIDEMDNLFSPTYSLTNGHEHVLSVGDYPEDDGFVVFPESDYI
jgi:hypothetical protein